MVGVIDGDLQGKHKAAPNDHFGFIVNLHSTSSELSPSTSYATSVTHTHSMYHYFIYNM